MADTLTPNYNFTKPEIGGSDDTWGVKLNTNWEELDEIIKRPVANLLDYGGADPTGATSSDLALADAITELGANGGKSALYIPGGTFLFETRHVINQNMISLFGDSGAQVQEATKGTKLRFNRGAGLAVIPNTGFFSNVSFIKDLTFEDSLDQSLPADRQSWDPVPLLEYQGSVSNQYVQGISFLGKQRRRYGLLGGANNEADATVPVVYNSDFAYSRAFECQVGFCFGGERADRDFTGINLIGLTADANRSAGCVLANPKGSVALNCRFEGNHGGIGLYVQNRGEFSPGQVERASGLSVVGGYYFRNPRDPGHEGAGIAGTASIVIGDPDHPLPFSDFDVPGVPKIVSETDGHGISVRNVYAASDYSEYSMIVGGERYCEYVNNIVAPGTSGKPIKLSARSEPRTVISRNVDQNTNLIDDVDNPGNIDYRTELFLTAVTEQVFPANAGKRINSIPMTANLADDPKITMGTATEYGATKTLYSAPSSGGNETIGGIISTEVDGAAGNWATIYAFDDLPNGRGPIVLSVVVDQTNSNDVAYAIVHAFPPYKNGAGVEQAGVAVKASQHPTNAFELRVQGSSVQVRRANNAFRVRTVGMVADKKFS